LEVAGAEAEYTIARIADASWAVKISCAYTCGNYSGMSAPWDEKKTRQACVDAFLALARSHFGRRCTPALVSGNSKRVGECWACWKVGDSSLSRRSGVCKALPSRGSGGMILARPNVAQW
jgi:hypothetical protein